MYKLDMHVHINAFKLAPLHKAITANLNLNTFATTYRLYASGVTWWISNVGDYYKFRSLHLCQDLGQTDWTDDVL